MTTLKNFSLLVIVAIALAPCMSNAAAREPDQRGKKLQINPDNLTLLLADHAQLAGELNFDAATHWITKWKSADSVACWSCEVRAAGEYAVAITYSCPAPSKGSRFEVSAGESTVTGTVRTTTHRLSK